MIDFFSVSDRNSVFGRSIDLFENVDFHLPRGRYALLARSPEQRRLVLDVLAGLRPPREGHVSISGSISWPIGRSSVVRGRATGYDFITFVSELYGVDADQAGDIVTLLVSRPDYIDQPIDTWPPYVRQEFNFALALVPEFDIYVVDAPMPYEETRFTRLWQALFEERLVGKTLILSSYRPKQLLDYCAKGLVYEGGQLFIDHDLESCIERYPARPAREEIGLGNADSGQYTELDF